MQDLTPVRRAGRRPWAATRSASSPARWATARTPRRSRTPSAPASACHRSRTTRRDWRYCAKPWGRGLVQTWAEGTQGRGSRRATHVQRSQGRLRAIFRRNLPLRVAGGHSAILGRCLSGWLRPLAYGLGRVDSASRLGRKSHGSRACEREAGVRSCIATSRLRVRGVGGGRFCRRPPWDPDSVEPAFVISLIAIVIVAVIALRAWS
jgi:hypothetical protein